VDARIARQRSKTYTDLASAFSKPEPGLEREFTRLFLGPGRPVVHPYESVHREGRMMGTPAVEVRRFMADEGVTPYGRILPDHVSVELAFMGYLTRCEASSWEAGDGERAIHYLNRQERFLREHLMRWLPQFCHRILTGRPHAHYSALAHGLQSAVAADLLQIQAWRAATPDDASAGGEMRDWWRVGVDSDCTLCSVCVQVCGPGALRLVSQETATILSYEATLCNGCAACQRWCPEEAIHVNRVDECPAGSELVRSARLTCPGCGRLYAPASMVDNVRGLLGEMGEAMLQRLIMCPDCKTKDMRLGVEKRSSRQAG
jgi:TorA maturation chaperone TorD/Pyruvate/2-oxoacid:ferredoxin oxidoreductase delta subunit